MAYGEDVGTLAGRVKSAKMRRKSRRPRIPRFVALLLVTIFIGGVGFLFRSFSLPAKEDKILKNGPPQYIIVDTTDRYAKVHLTSYIHWKGSSAEESLYITVTGPRLKASTSILITSSSASDLFTPAVFRYGDNLSSVEQAPQYVETITVRQLASLKDTVYGFGSYLGSFKLPEVAQVSNGSFFAHLPLVALGETFSSAQPDCMTEHLPSDGPDNIDVIDFPQQKSGEFSHVSRNVSDYKTPANSSGHVLYWRPQRVYTTEILHEVQDEVTNAQINSDEPTNGHLQDRNFIWQGTGSLEPTLSATHNDRAMSEERWNFYSGVVFGVAAAAVVAIVGELPKAIPLPWRHRKRRPA